MQLILMALGVSAVIGLKAATGRAAAGTRPGGTLPPVDQLPAIAELPNPLLFNDGSPLTSSSDWARRRQEILDQVMYYEYGRMAPAPANVKGQEQPSVENLTLGATERQVHLTCGPEGKVAFDVELTLPGGKGPFPVIVTGDLCWGRRKDPIRKMVAERGYVLAEFDRTRIVPDRRDVRGGAYTLYPDADWAALAVWAWGYHRVIDWLEAQEWVDGQKIAVTGHSRGGKAALLAGATDERIALTASNNSGCGGCGCYRHQADNSEDIAAITKCFPHWFAARFPEFIGKIDRLPFDQHSVKALVAPRALLETEALGDLWANPQGSQITWSAAREVYKFLGVEARIGIAFREGPHEYNERDWAVLLDFADQQLRGMRVDRRFDELAFPTAPKLRSWAAIE